MCVGAGVWMWQEALIKSNVSLEINLGILKILLID